MALFNGTNGMIIKSAAAAILAAAVIGGWAFATTRASSDDLETHRVLDRGRHVKTNDVVAAIKERAAEERLRAAVFRAQIRAALNVKEPKPELR